MTQSLEEIADRIIVCGEHQITSYHQKGIIGAVITVSRSNEVDDFDFDFSSLDVPHHVTTLYEDQDNGISTDLKTAEDFLNACGDKKLLIHCHAGRHRSPTFALILLMHLNKFRSSIDDGIAIIHRKKPDILLSASIPSYKDFLQDRYDLYRQSIVDYKRAQALNQCKDTASLKEGLKKNFAGQTEPSTGDLQKLGARFGMTLPTLTN